MRGVPGTTTVERQQVIQSTSGGRGPRGSRHSSGRSVPLVLQLLGAVLVITSVIVGVFTSHAGASALTNGTVTLKMGNSVATDPLANHQPVTVSVGPNSTLSRSSLEAAGFPSGAVTMKILQCADPGGQAANLPTKPTDCEPSTIDAGASLQEDGSVLDPGYTIYALPDPAELGVSNGTLCDTQHQCVLGIFSNQNDFSKPHLFSAPFQVTPTSTSGGATPTSTPSTPSSSGAGSASGGASAAVSVPPGTLANTGGPILWPWLLGAGGILLVGGTALRFLRRPAHEGRRR
jgi:hypothetical protein